MVISQRQQRGAFWTGTDAEQDNGTHGHEIRLRKTYKSYPETFAWSAVVSLVVALFGLGAMSHLSL
jgi:hypothetical protein